MRLRGPCRIAVRTDGGDWVSRLALRGALRSFRSRLPDAEVSTLVAEGPWDVELVLSSGARDPLAPLAGYGLPDEVLRKRLGMAEIVGWLPSGDDRPSVVSTIGLDEQWAEGFAAAPSLHASYVLRVDDGLQTGRSAILPDWASDSDRAVACAAADLVVVGPDRFGAAAVARGRVIFCGGADEFPPATPRALIAGAPSELAEKVEQALSGSLPPYHYRVELDDRLDELAVSAAEAAFERAPEAFRRWAAEKAELADALTAELEDVRNRRRDDRAVLGETGHRLAYAEEQYGHCDHARLRAEEELSRLQRSRAVRIADRIARLKRA